MWGLDLSVRWGEFLVIFGANGVGKTTLLQILSAQSRPDGGSVMIGAVDRRTNPVTPAADGGSSGPR